MILLHRPVAQSASRRSPAFRAKPLRIVEFECHGVALVGQSAGPAPQLGTDIELRLDFPQRAELNTDEGTCVDQKYGVLFLSTSSDHHPHLCVSNCSSPVMEAVLPSAVANGCIDLPAHT